MYKSKSEFIKNTPKAIRKIGLIEYIHGLKNEGLGRREIEAKMLADNVSTSPKTIPHDYSIYEKHSEDIGWM